MMSNRYISEFGEAEQSVLIVSDEPVFSGQLSEMLLRVGVPSLVFVSSAQAMERVHQVLPTLILLHATNAYLSRGITCYQQLQSDPIASAIPTLFYTPALVLSEREVGAAPQKTEQHIESDVLVARFVESILLARQRIEPEADMVQTMPHGRDDL